MGCLFSKSANHTKLSEDESPQEFSWDKRKQLDVKNFVLDKQSGETIGRLPGSINGQQFIIQNCENCDIYVFDHCATVTVDDCVNCRIFIAAIKSSIFVRDCTDCVVATSCQQFRTRDCKKLTAFLCCVTQPIIESTTGVKFGCLKMFYPQFEQHLQAAGISRFNNNWNNIHDFTPVPGENNCSFLQQQVSLTDYLPLPTVEPLNTIEVSVEARNSVIPYTFGSKQRPAGHSCLIAIFHFNHQIQLTTNVMAMLQEFILVQTAEMTMNDSQAKRVFKKNDCLPQASLNHYAVLLHISYK